MLPPQPPGLPLPLPAEPLFLNDIAGDVGEESGGGGSAVSELVIVTICCSGFVGTTAAALLLLGENGIRGGKGGCRFETDAG